MPTNTKELIPKEFVKILAVWSLIPAYAIGGGLIGYALDRALGWFPYLTCAGLLLALIMAIRDMLRLKTEWW